MPAKWPSKEAIADGWKRFDKKIQDAGFAYLVVAKFMTPDEWSAFCAERDRRDRTQDEAKREWDRLRDLLSAVCLVSSSVAAPAGTTWEHVEEDLCVRIAEAEKAMQYDGFLPSLPEDVIMERIKRISEAQ